MARAERPRGLCPVCSKDCAITDEDGVRHHFTEDPEKQAGPDSRKCRGVGQPPAGAKPATPGGLSFLCRIPAGPDGCGKEVQLTANHRARSHLNGQDVPCPGGSDWPLALGADGVPTDTAPWTEEDWEIVLPRPERSGEILPAARPEDLKIEQETDFDPRPVQDVDLPHDRGVSLGEPESGPDPALPNCPHPETHRAGCGCPDDDWHTPADLLALMPEDVQALARSAPLCWDCGHQITPLVERFEMDGSVKHVIWACEHGGYCDCAAQPTGCRVGGLAEALLSDLDEGVLFVRHTARAPLNKLVYQAGEPRPGALAVTIVTSGLYAGRTGNLTNLTEEVTCTDKTGRPVPRRDRGTGATSPITGSPPPPDPPSTPSTPRTAPSPTQDLNSRPHTPATASAALTRSKRATSSGPSTTATTSTQTATTSGPVADAFSTPKEAVRESDKYDSYGRYKLLHPDSRKKVNWTRATTFCKSIQDTYALSLWSQRMVLKGASIRSDLTAAAGTLEVKADKDRMNGLVDEAKKAAGDKIAANKGTAVHAYTEDLDKELVGMPVVAKTVPGEFIPTVQAYKEILASFGLVPVPGLIEFTTAVKQYEVAGTADRVYQVTRDITIKLNGRPVTLYAGEYVIGDVKTGADLSYGWQEIAIQLALYAQGLNTSGVWDWGTRVWSRPEDGGGHQIQVRTDVGIVPHLPVDRSETQAPLATLYAVDLTAGWAAAVLCGQVRSWRKERTLATPLEIADVADRETDPGTGVPYQALAQAASAPVSRPVPASRPVTLQDKARAVTSQAEASSVWKEAVAARTPKSEVDSLVQIMQKKLASFTEKGA